jgi:PAS domain S-box-containing protein
MSNSNGARIPAESKIIVGVEHSPTTGWHALHLHDSLYAVSVQPDRHLVVIGEGTGRRRLRHLSIPFNNILRFEAVEQSIGHNCLVDPVNADLLGDSKLIPEDQPFRHVAVRLLVKPRTENNFFAIYDLGTTPLPILVPSLKHLPDEVKANPNVALKSADDCYTLARATLKWVERVNNEIEKAREGVSVAVGADLPITAQSTDPHRERLQAMLDELESYDSYDVIQCKAAAGTAVVIATHLISNADKNALVGTVSLCSTFRLEESIVDRNHPPYSTVDELYQTCLDYQATTGRPIEEAFDTVAEHLSDLKERKIEITSSGDLRIIADNAPKPLDLVDVIGKVNEKRRVLARVELRHETQLHDVYGNEAIEIYELENLPFLSVLLEYKTTDEQRNFAVFLKSDLHQAMREFLLAHELGNFYNQIKADASPANRVKRFLRSSFFPTFLDKEADHFGMSFLFPPAYLADRMIFRGEISTDELLDEFLAEMEPVTATLRNQMRTYIDQHINRHRELEQAKEPSFLEFDVQWIEPEDVSEVIELIEKVKPPVYWVLLDEDSVITGASPNSDVLFGLSDEELIGKRPTELVVAEERAEMMKRAAFRKDRLKKIYYFTETRNLVDGSTHQVIVYSFPIIKDDEYFGAMATISPLVEIKPKSETKEQIADSETELEPALAGQVASETRYFQTFAGVKIGGADSL